jgi:hypothetical protein
MTSQETTTYLARSLRLQSLVCVALLALIPGQLLTSRVCGAEDAADPYDAFYDVLMTRYGPDGKSYAQNETSPAIFGWSAFPFDDKTFKKFHTALFAFSTLPQERIEQYSDVKRALLQLHLWKVFDTTFNWDWPKDWYWGGRRSFPKTHMDRRAALQPAIASLIRRLALTKEQILALPDTMAATVKSGVFPRAHDPTDRFKPFLPADLVSRESSWICLGEDRTAIPAGTHTSKHYSRSMFLQFMRLPGGRAETLSHMERLKEQPEQFPVGTQFALMERPFLISKEGELVLSPLTVSVQLRAYLNVTERFTASVPTQCVTEFVMQPRELMKDNAAMRAMAPGDFRYEAGAPMAAGFSPRDPFATGPYAGRMPRTTRLNLCMSCHGGAGGRGVMTRGFCETSPEEVSKATSAQKRDDEKWTALQEHWRSRTSPKVDAAKLALLSKPTPKPEDPDNPKLTEQQKNARTVLIDRIESEVVNELKTLHTAVLWAEIERLSARFEVEDAEISRLRLAARSAANSAVEKTRKSLMSNIRKNTNYAVNRHDVDVTGIKVHGKYINLDPASNNPNDKNLIVRVVRASARTSYSVGFAWISHGNTAGPTDSDVRKEELWTKALAAVLTEEQLGQYAIDSRKRFESAVRDLVLTALQFNLDVEESQLPALRARVDERVNPDPKRSYYLESKAGQIRQKLQAQQLADVLTQEQLNRRAEHTKSRVKSAMVSLILTVMQFDLQLQDSQLPMLRRRLEDKINPGRVERSIEDTAMRVRRKLKAEDFADILTESQRTLWRFTQEH